MHASRFDTLARTLAGSMTRRTIARALSGIALSGTLGRALAPERALAVAQSAAVCPAGANPIGLGPQDGIAQTFTPTLSGKVSRVDVTMSHILPTTAGYVLRILRTDETGTPLFSPVLAKKTLPLRAVPNSGDVSLTFSFKKRKAAKVVAGTIYGILVTRTDPAEGATGRGRTGNPYPEGNNFSFNATNNSFFASADIDLVFEVFVGY
jgi:hypothetical protein